MQNCLLDVQQLEVLAKEIQIQLSLAKKHEGDVFHRVEDVKRQLQLVQADLENQLLELCSAQTSGTEATGALRLLETNATLCKASAEV